MPVIYDEKKLTPIFTASQGETQAQYLDRIKAMKTKSAGTGIKTMLPPKLEKPEVEELEQRS